MASPVLLLASLDFWFIVGAIVILIFSVYWIYRINQPAEAEGDMAISGASHRIQRRVIDHLTQSSTRSILGQTELRSLVSPVGHSVNTGISQNIETATKVGVKEQRRRAQKEAKQEERENMQQLRENKQQKADEKWASYMRKQQEKEGELAKNLQEEKRIQDAQRKRDDEVYQQWKATFAIESSGHSNNATDTMNELLSKFISYIKKRKVVALDDLAREFDLKTKDVIARIRDLEKIEELNGVFDDRGKYIHITINEMTQLVDYINRKGRISKEDDLVQACNRIIRLHPSDTVISELKDLEQNAMNLIASLELN
ncbi:hypothetical protein IE077_000695 [Cardiosporidium cionae]|uniref:DDRGK domain-containing protein 1 n=1 Tax=Cardiosporidium cionae TaxID=476202 RepID=A0ABQ7J6N6_9APIC|nr:hypothetical protein IE077_000695 [Cardiosporidium cionae]|eukprot:KAF8819662.1 hypothetical protein IE077_000695 [Cardiosporidium cionae]